MAITKDMSIVEIVQTYLIEELNAAIGEKSAAAQ